MSRFPHIKVMEGQTEHHLSLISFSGKRAVVAGNLSLKDYLKKAGGRLKGEITHNNEVFHVSLNAADFNESETNGLEIVCEITEIETLQVLWKIRYDLSELHARKTHRGENSPEIIPRMFRFDERSRMERVEFIRKKTGLPLTEITRPAIPASEILGLTGNYIGAVEIPVGLAGPLLFDGKDVKGTLYAPVATVEGALVESITRGCLAITRSGGVRTCFIKQRMLRVPLFEFYSLDDAVFFTDWLGDNESRIREIVSAETRHGKICEIVPRIIGRSVHVKFLYMTGDAAGQNMTTTCTWLACKWIKEQIAKIGLKLKGYGLDGNISSDKKLSYNNYINGRGHRVAAETVLKEEVIKEVLNISSDVLCHAWLQGSIGAFESGMVGYTVNAANVIAAIFTATGQDIASVSESSSGLVYMEMQGKDVYASMTLPGLVLGTVGGGTRLPACAEALEMIGCLGKEKAGRLGEIIAGFCLALDISTLSAIASDVFATAHEKLARKPSKLHRMKGKTG
jgi:NADP-dependent 3-hydroxy-3-methylglutaryl-CoA reductase